MYNSYTVNILVKIKNTFDRCYKFSLIKRIIDCIVSLSKRLSSGSLLWNFWTNDKSYIEGSKIYSIYGNLIDKINRFVLVVKRALNKYIQGSQLLSIVSKKSNQGDAILVALIGFNITLILLKLLNIVQMNNILVAVLGVLALFSVILVILDVKMSNVFKNSYVIQRIASIFTMDDGGEQWW